MRPKTRRPESIAAMENKRAVIVVHGVGDQDNEGIELKGSGRMTATDPKRTYSFSQSVFSILAFNKSQN